MRLVQVQEFVLLNGIKTLQSKSKEEDGMQKPDIAKLKQFFFRFRRQITVSATAVFSVLLICSLIAAWTVPGYVREKLDKVAYQHLNRHLHVGHIRFNPLTFGVTLRDISLSEPDGDQTFASAGSLYVNFSFFSVFTSAPIIRSLSIETPTLYISRTDDYEYNFSDLLARALEPGERQEYSIGNIEVAGGKIIFDDMPVGRKHLVEDIHISIPSVSTRASQIMSSIEPRLSAVVNGHRLELSGKAHPFAADMDAVFSLTLDDIELAQYVGYLPYKPKFTLDKGSLSFDLNVHYARDKAAASEFEVSGKVKISSLHISDLARKPMVSVEKLDADLKRSAVFARNFHLGALHLTKPEIHVAYSADGFLSLMNLLPQQQSERAKPASAAEKGESAKSHTKIIVNSLDAHEAKLSYTDFAAAVPHSVIARNMNLTVKGTEVDTGSQTVTVEALTSDSASLEAALEKRSFPASRTGSGTKESSGYRVKVGKVDVSGWSASVQNKNIRKPYGLRLSGLSAHIENVSTEPNNVSEFRILSETDKKGRISVEGKAGLSPLHADIEVDMTDVPVVGLQQYIDEHVNLALRGAELTARGRLSLAAARSGALRGQYRGDMRITNLSTTDLIRNDPFVRWKDLTLRQVNAELSPFSLTIANADLSGFYARLILSQEGRLNLQNILRSEAGGEVSLTDSEASDGVTLAKQKEVQPDEPYQSEAKEVTAQPEVLSEAEDKSGDEKTTESARETISPDAQDEVAKAAGDEGSTGSANDLADMSEEVDLPVIRIGRLQLGDGRIRFTDNFVEPNYTADIDRVQGVISKISSERDALAEVDIKGQVNRAPMTLKGTANPFNPSQSLELHGQVKGMELAQLSAYSTKYVGHGIERGKLSFDVRYSVKDGQLHAQNSLVLDQLVFSEKRDVKPILSLPVLFAVSLLQDANGVIDINLPVSGSLDDPRFSVGGVVMRMILNLFARIVTSPFSILASALGGGQELSRIDFVPGHSDITAQGEEALVMLSKALKARPALRLDIAGCYDVELDKEGVARTAIRRKVRELKRKEARDADEDAPQERVAVSDEEYARLLKQIYSSASFKKPRNFIGFPKSLSVAEMEKLMIENYAVSEEELKAIADRRANNVKAWFLDKGDIPDERLFISASKSLTGENSARVDFNLH